ncbi:hypothetical protein HPP92_021733 [Vanilla planifolia]|uniref:Uncharacterized protein n=1 Tax=Vanilla planifolia TaxID=51239 RepID=A0A835PVY2_VANPL|nr:hypothetical protein HPP92_021733 [Vanilla planifolia]
MEMAMRLTDDAGEAKGEEAWKGPPPSHSPSDTGGEKQKRKERSRKRRNGFLHHLLLIVLPLSHLQAPELPHG